jgi:hypothetical protein
MAGSLPRIFSLLENLYISENSAGTTEVDVKKLTGVYSPNLQAC